MPFELAGKQRASRLILGTGGFPSLDLLREAIEASGTELVTVALRRIDPAMRGSLVDVLDAAGVELLPNTAGCFTARDAVHDREARPRGLRDRPGQARGHRRRAHAAARRARAARRRRGAGRRRLHRAALHQRRPRPRAAPGGRRLRGGHAARVADRLRHRHRQPVQHRADRRAARACRSSSTPASGPRRTRRWRWSSAATPCCARARSPARRTPCAMARAIRAAVEAGRAALEAGRIPRRRYAEASVAHARAGRTSPAARSSDRRARSTPSRPPGRGAAAPRSRSRARGDLHYEDPLCDRAAAGRRRARRPRREALDGVPRRRASSRRASGSPTARYVAAPVKLLGHHRGELRACRRRTASSSSTRSSTASCATTACSACARSSTPTTPASRWALLPKRGTIGERALLMLRGFGLRSLERLSP